MFSFQRWFAKWLHNSQSAPLRVGYSDQRDSEGDGSASPVPMILSQQFRLESVDISIDEAYMHGPFRVQLMITQHHSI